MARAAVPAIGLAALATVAGFLVLVLSPVPMVQGFGLLLVAGVGIAFACALTGGTALLVALERRRAGGDGLMRRRAARGELRGRGLPPPGGLAGRRARRGVLGAAVARPGRVLAVALAAAAIGWVVDTQTEVRSDLPELVPQDLAAVRDLETLQATTGVAGEVDVVVEAGDVADPAVLTWMQRFQDRVLEDVRYSPDNGCGEAALCPALSLPDLFQGEGATADAARVDALLDAVPPYFSRAVITGDRRTANLAFGIRLMPLDEQHEVIERVRALLDPPPGVRARVAGLPVLAAEANAQLASPARRLGTLLAGLLAVFVVLAVARRGLRRAWVPLVPIALATGWSALILFALRIRSTRCRRRSARSCSPSRRSSPCCSRRACGRSSAAAPALGGGARPRVPVDGRRGARLGRDGDRGVRRARVLRRADAARVRPRDRRRPHRVARRRARRAAGRARAGRAPQAGTPATAPPNELVRA